MAEFIDFQPRYVEDEDSIRARFDTDADPDVDKRQGGFYQVTTEPSVKEFARLWDILNDVIGLSSYLFANDIYLDYKAAEVNLTRKPASLSVGTVTFTGTNGTVIPSGTRVSTTALTETDVPQRFTTNVSATVSGTTVDVAVTAAVAGIDGNVSANAVNIIEDNIAHLSAVNNAAAMADGADLESDDDLRTRIGLEIAAPQGAGNVSDYKKWARSRSGVGPNVTVVPMWNGVNTVKVIILDNDNRPVGQTVLDDVQQYLTGAPKDASPLTAVTLSDGGVGGSLVAGTYYYKVTFTDGFGETKGSPASLSITTVGTHLVDLSAIPVGDSSTTARNIYRSTDGVSYYYLDQIADNTTTVYVDDGSPAISANILHKTNNTTNSDGIAPVGASVTVDTPSLVNIDVVATIEHFPGYTLDGTGGTIPTRPGIVAAITAYVNTLSAGGDVIYRKSLSTFFSVTGVEDVLSLTLNTGTTDVAISNSQVATINSITLS